MKLRFYKWKYWNIHPEVYSICLIFIAFYFCLVQTKELWTLPWGDEFSYINPILLEVKWSFFLPWNYRPEYFMGHPMGQSLILWTALHLFVSKVFVAKTTTLGLSLLCLFNLYKMTGTLFQDRWVSFFSVILTMFLPLFWLHSTLVWAHIPLMAFGFGTIYAFTAKKYKTLLLYSLGLATIRESALAFFLPLIFQGLCVSSQRKSLFYIIPSLFLFSSHFFLFFIRTDHWIAHPYTYGGLPHNPNPVFFDFSRLFERLPYFLNNFFHQYPLSFWLLLLSAGIFYFVKGLKSVAIFRGSKKHSHQNIKEKAKNNTFNSVQAPIFIPLSICILFFVFWITYPDFGMRNFFPVLVLFIPLSLCFIIRTIPFSRFLLTVICCALLLNPAFPSLRGISHNDKKGFPLASLLIPLRTGPALVKERRQRISKAKSLASFLEFEYGDPIRYMEKWIYAPYPYDQIMRSSFYGYVKNSYTVDHWRFFEDPERYGAVILVRKDISNRPYNEDCDQHCEDSYNKKIYKYLTDSDSFTETPFPSFSLQKKFVLFVHREVQKHLEVLELH